MKLFGILFLAILSLVNAKDTKKLADEQMAKNLAKDFYYKPEGGTKYLCGNCRDKDNQYKKAKCNWNNGQCPSRGEGSRCIPGMTV